MIDQALPVLMASLPEYDHQIVHVNRARGMQMLREQPFVCDPALMFNLQRAQWIAFSITSFRVFSNGLAVRRKDRDGVQPFIHDGQIDLRALLASAPHNVGVVAERSYGEQIDSLLAQAPPGALMAHYGNSAIGNLLQMQRHGRLKALIGYQPEIRFQAQQQGIDPNELEFYPIQGMPKYQSVNVGCSNTAQGRQAVERINRALLELRPTPCWSFMPSGWNRRCASNTAAMPWRFPRCAAALKNPGKNPEQWGDDSGLNVVCKQTRATSDKHRSTMLDPVAKGLTDGLKRRFPKISNQRALSNAFSWATLRKAAMTQGSGDLRRSTRRDAGRRRHRSTGACRSTGPG